MTPLQLAKRACPNYDLNDVCLGVDYDEALNEMCLWEKKPPRCVLADDTPCPYFETAILAGIETLKNEDQVDEQQEAQDKYERMKKRYEQRKRDEADSGSDEGGVVGASPLRTAGNEEGTTSADAIEGASTETHPDRSIRRIIRRNTDVAERASGQRRTIRRIGVRDGL